MGTIVMQLDEVVRTLEGYKNELEGILSRFKKTRNGLSIDRDDDSRFVQIVMEMRDLFSDELIDGHRQANHVLLEYREGLSNYFGSQSYRSVENIKSLVASTLVRIQRNPLTLKAAAIAADAHGEKNPQFVVTLAERLHGVVHQLRDRRENRATLDVSDEYDLQDLFHALLKIHFDDVRKEEWAPTYAGGASRMDFLLPEIETVVETKMMRGTLSTKQLGDELIVDIAKYQKHPQCRTLFCLVYDPLGRVANPRGVESDLSQNDDKMATRVMIVPKLA